MNNRHVFSELLFAVVIIDVVFGYSDSRYYDRSLPGSRYHEDYDRRITENSDYGEETYQDAVDYDMDGYNNVGYNEKRDTVYHRKSKGPDYIQRKQYRSNYYSGSLPIKDDNVFQNLPPQHGPEFLDKSRSPPNVFQNLIRKCLITNRIEDCHEFIEIGANTFRHYQDVFSSSGFPGSLRGGQDPFSSNQRQIRKCALTNILDDCNKFGTISYVESSAPTSFGNEIFSRNYAQNQFSTNSVEFKIRKCAITGKIEDCGIFVTILNYTPVEQVLDSLYSSQNDFRSEITNDKRQPLKRKCLITNRPEECFEFLEIAHHFHETQELQDSGLYHQGEKTVRKCAITNELEDCDKFVVVSYYSLVGEDWKPPSYVNRGRHQLRKCVITNKINDCAKFVEVSYNLIENNVALPKKYRVRKCAITHLLGDCIVLVEILVRDSSVLGYYGSRAYIDANSKPNEVRRCLLTDITEDCGVFVHLPEYINNFSGDSSDMMVGSYKIRLCAITNALDDCTTFISVYYNPRSNDQTGYDENYFQERKTEHLGDGLPKYRYDDLTLLNQYRRDVSPIRSTIDSSSEKKVLEQNNFGSQGYRLDSSRPEHRCTIANGVRKCFAKKFPDSFDYEDYAYQRNEELPHTKEYHEGRGRIVQHRRRKYPRRQNIIRDQTQHGYQIPRKRDEFEQPPYQQSLEREDEIHYKKPRRKVPSQVDVSKSGQQKTRKCVVINGIEDCRWYPGHHYDTNTKETRYYRKYRKYPDRKTYGTSFEKDSPDYRENYYPSRGKEEDYDQRYHHGRTDYDDDFIVGEDDLNIKDTSKRPSDITRQPPHETPKEFGLDIMKNEKPFRDQFKESTRNNKNDITRNEENHKSESYDSKLIEKETRELPPYLREHGSIDREEHVSVGSKCRLVNGVKECNDLVDIEDNIRDYYDQSIKGDNRHQIKTDQRQSGGQSYHKNKEYQQTTKIFKEIPQSNGDTYPENKDYPQGNKPERSDYTKTTKTTNEDRHSGDDLYRENRDYTRISGTTDGTRHPNVQNYPGNKFIDEIRQSDGAGYPNKEYTEITKATQEHQQSGYRGYPGNREFAKTPKTVQETRQTADKVYSKYRDYPRVSGTSKENRQLGKNRYSGGENYPLYPENEGHREKSKTTNEYRQSGDKHYPEYRNYPRKHDTKELQNIDESSSLGIEPVYEKKSVYLLGSDGDTKNLQFLSGFGHYYGEVKLNSYGKPQVVMCNVKNNKKECREFVEENQIACKCNDGLQCNCENSGLKSDQNGTFSCRCNDFDKFLQGNGSFQCQCIRDSTNSNTSTCQCSNDVTSSTRSITCERTQGDEPRRTHQAQQNGNQEQVITKSFECKCSNTSLGVTCACNSDTSQFLGNKSVTCWCFEKFNDIICNCSKEINQLSEVINSNQRGIWCQCSKGRDLTEPQSLVCPCKYNPNHNASVAFKTFRTQVPISSMQHFMHGWNKTTIPQTQNTTNATNEVKSPEEVTVTSLTTHSRVDQPQTQREYTAKRTSSNINKSGNDRVSRGEIVTQERTTTSIRSHKPGLLENIVNLID